MPQDMLATGLAFLANQLAENAAKTVRYVRGGQSVEVRAVCGRKLLKLDAEDGRGVVQWTDMDFLIRGADLSIGGETITPERGDLIFAVFGTKTEVYEVAPYGSDPPWMWSDPHQSMLRIHTKHVETEDAA